MGILQSKSIEVSEDTESNSFAKDDGSEGKEDKSILVLGAGNFGTCLADHLASLGNEVTIWARSQEVVDGINLQHKNVKYLSHVLLSENLKATTVLNQEVFDAVTVVICAIPSQLMRTILERVKPFLTTRHLLIFVNKGIEKGTLSFPHDIVVSELGEEIGYNATFLSGPSFAAEVVERKHTCVTAASLVHIRALRTQKLFHAPHFRVYDATDVIGVEVAGALKNVMALASGCSSGIGLQLNARAALITRALAEITRIGVKLGANPLTFAGLSGVGDLFLTCTSEKSRNFTVGYRLGKGEKLDDVIRTLGSVAEGVETVPAAYELCRKLGVDSPIIDAVHAVLMKGLTVDEVFKNVTHRSPKSELTH
ncbi:hypothetical protein HK099_006428 [Clydaea vesicula]|uniref:Glycerol-3-phosphate dehydrogenase [NAD(+)] n=1 Tax=Clydaea vesicula TaxID=447962 RepID=A0AAD5XWZ5_9FUNG|nr:hypothetical protein HK099_006428 [Clydaea vesicula]KAJ3379683.1 hypothetical protein HDU92_006530 [Lobulomyces angularis]